MLSPISSSNLMNKSSISSSFIGRDGCYNYDIIGAEEFFNNRPEADSADSKAYRNALQSENTRVGQWLRKCFTKHNDFAQTENGQESPVAELSPEQELAVRTVLLKQAADRTMESIIATGMVTENEWDESLLTDEAILTWLTYYPMVKYTTHFGKYGEDIKGGNYDDWVSTLASFPIKEREKILTILRTLRCNLSEPNLLRFTTTQIPKLPLLISLLKSGIELAPDLCFELMQRVSVLDTKNNREKFSVKFEALRLLNAHIADISPAERKDWQSGIALSNIKINKIIGYAYNYGGYAWRSFGGYYDKCPDYNEFPVLALAIKAGVNVGDDLIETWFDKGANRLHLLARLNTDHVLDPSKDERYIIDSNGYPFEDIIRQDVSKYLLDAFNAACEQGDAVDADTIEGHTPLHLAAQARSSRGEVVKFLLDRGASMYTNAALPAPPGKERPRVLPLTCAILGGLRHNMIPGALTALLNAGADPNKLDADTFTALDRLMQFAHTPISLDIAEILLDRDAKLTDIDHKGRVPAWCEFARRHNRDDLINRLLASVLYSPQ